MTSQPAPGERYQSFSAFYPYYIHEHSNRTCRRIHVVGSALVIGVVVSKLNAQRVAQRTGDANRAVARPTVDHLGRAEADLAYMQVAAADVDHPHPSQVEHGLAVRRPCERNHGPGRLRLG